MKRMLAPAAVVLMFACAAPAPEPAKPAAPAEVPITSKSPDAIDHFKKGRDLLDNLRVPEAAQEMDQALKLDPDFVLAMVYKANATPGAEGPLASPLNSCIANHRPSRIQAGTVTIQKKITIQTKQCTLARG